MSETATRTIILPADIAAAIDAAVAEGQGASFDAIAAQALRQWREDHDLFGYTLAELRVLVQEGIDSGPARHASIDGVKQEARSRLSASRKSA